MRSRVGQVELIAAELGVRDVGHLLQDVSFVNTAVFIAVTHGTIRPVVEGLADENPILWADQDVRGCRGGLGEALTPVAVPDRQRNNREW